MFNINSIVLMKSSKQVSNSPHQKASLKLPLGSSANTKSSGVKTMGTEGDQQQHVVYGAPNTLIISKGSNVRPELTSARTKTSGGPNLSYSKTLTQHIQHYSAAMAYNSTKAKKRSSEVGTANSTVMHNQSSSGLHQTGTGTTKRIVHKRTGSTSNANSSSMVGASSTKHITPSRAVMGDGSTTTKAKTKKKRSNLTNATSFQTLVHQHATAFSNSNSRGNLLVPNNQMSYLKQSQQLQEARNNRDSFSGTGAKKSLRLTTHGKSTANAASMRQQSNQTQQPHGSLLMGNAGMRTNLQHSTHHGYHPGGMSDTSFNNMTIRSGDKYNSTIMGKKSLAGGKQMRQVASVDQQATEGNFPQSAKNTTGTEKKSVIFQVSSGAQLIANHGVHHHHQSTKTLDKFSSQQPSAGKKQHLMSSGGSMIELGASQASKEVQPKLLKNATIHNSASVFQRSHHQIYHSKNQSIGGMSYSSNNSRFTTTRPKNPTEGSVSSKGSIDSAPSHFGIMASTTGARLKQKLSQQQIKSKGAGVAVGSVSLHVSQQPGASDLAGSDLMNTNTSMSPQKSLKTGNYATNSAIIQSVQASKFNLVNRVIVPSTNSNNVQTQQLPTMGQQAASTALSPSAKSINTSITTKQNTAQKLQPEVQQNTRKLPHQGKSGNNQSFAGAAQSAEILLSGQESSEAAAMLKTQTNLTTSAKKSFRKSEIQPEQKGAKTITIKMLETHNSVNAPAEDNKGTSITSSTVQPSASAPILQPQTNQQKEAGVTTTVSSVSKQLTSLKQQLKQQIVKQASQQDLASEDQTQEKKEEPATQSALSNQMPYKSNPQQPSSTLGVIELVPGDTQQSSAPQFPMSPATALEHFSSSGLLSDYEKVEILNYPEVFFLGMNAQKIHGKAGTNQHNYGYDDDRGDYQVVMKDQLAYRWEVLDKLGSGSFGQALKCFDHKTKQTVAIKVIRNKKRFQYQAGVELRLLKILKDADKNDENNIIRIHDYEIFRKHLLLSFELLSMNLYEFIKQNNFQGVSTGLIRRFAIQILQALKFQRDQNIIHCDLKPENILLKQPNKSGIKIIDYGSSCFQNSRIYTYIQSRFYRAPEIILGIPYTTSIDMWSFGCIMAELYTGHPLFPGENEAEQLAYVMEIKGVPPDYIIELSSRRQLFFEPDSFYPVIVTNSRGRRRMPNTKTLSNVLRKCTDTKFVDFIDACLDWDPVNRITPLEALQHEWILEGLPDKVLVHHQRMFGGRDDKRNLKEASLTNVQGFPEEANSKTIYDIVAELKTQDARRRRNELQQAAEQIRAQRATGGPNQNNRDSSAYATAPAGPSGGSQTQKTLERVQSQENIKEKSDKGEIAPPQIMSKVQSMQIIKQSKPHECKVELQKSVVSDKDLEFVAAMSQSSRTHTARQQTTRQSNKSSKKKIDRSFQQSQSTHVLPQAKKSLEQPPKSTSKGGMIVADGPGGQSWQFTSVVKAASIDSQSQASSTVALNNHPRKARLFDQSHSIEDGVNNAYLDSQTEAQDYAADAEKQSEELTRMKKKALIQKTSSAAPLKTLSKFVVRDGEGDLGENVSSDPEGQIQLKSCASKPSIMQSCVIPGDSVVDDYQIGASLSNHQVRSEANGGANPADATGGDDDFEDLAMPTDDEGVTSYSHTQKIPISLIKKQDKASVSATPFESLYSLMKKLFQPMPANHHSQNSGSMLSAEQHYGAYGQTITTDRASQGKARGGSFASITDQKMSSAHHQHPHTSSTKKRSEKPFKVSVAGHNSFATASSQAGPKLNTLIQMTKQAKPSMAHGKVSTSSKVFKGTGHRHELATNAQSAKIVYATTHNNNYSTNRSAKHPQPAAAANGVPGPQKLSGLLADTAEISQTAFYTYRPTRASDSSGKPTMSVTVQPSAKSKQLGSSGQHHRFK